MKNTIKVMRRELADNLKLEGVEVPSTERLLTLLNRAKDHVAAQIELCNENQLVVRKTFTVAAGDASITLPDGSGADPAVKRVVAIRRTDTGTDIPCRVVPHYEQPVYQDYDGYVNDEMIFYLEGITLYFAYRNGAPDAMTLVMSYVGETADATDADVTETYDLIPNEWADLIPLYATLLALPAASLARTKYAELYKDRLNTLERSVPQRFRTEPLGVRPDVRW